MDVSMREKLRGKITFVKILKKNVYFECQHCNALNKSQKEEQTGDTWMCRREKNIAKTTLHVFQNDTTTNKRKALMFRIGKIHVRGRDMFCYNFAIIAFALLAEEVSS